MASVTFPTALGGDGKTYTDDADPSTGLDGLGYITRLVPLFENGLAMAAYTAKYAAKIDAAATNADRAENAQKYVGAMASEYHINLIAELERRATLLADFIGSLYRVDDGIVSQTGLDILAFVRNTPKKTYTPSGLLHDIGSNVLSREWRQGKAKGVLLEEQKTNRLLFSNRFDASPWFVSNASVKESTVTSPVSGHHAYFLQEGGTASEKRVNQVVSLDAGSENTLSVFVKPTAQRSQVYLRLIDTFTIDLFDIRVNVSDGSYSTMAGGNADIVGHGVEALPDGWYRVWVSGRLNETTTEARLSIIIALNSSLGYQGDGVSGVYVAGGQFESGRLPSSYIYTQDTQVTRAGDTITRSVGTEINNNAGTLYVDFEFWGEFRACEIAKLDDGGASNRISIFASTSSSAQKGASQFRMDFGNESIAVITMPRLERGKRYRVAFAWDRNACAGFCNGVKSGDASYATTFPALTRFMLGANMRQFKCSRVLYVPFKEADETLINATSIEEAL